MTALDPGDSRSSSPARMTPAELPEDESLVDLGEDSTKYTRLTTEVTAQQ